MNVLWTHNFDPSLENSGTFMKIFAKGIRELGVDVELCYLGNLRSARNFWQARSLVKSIAGDFDIVHAQFGSACALATAAATHVPKVLSLRGSDWHRYKEKWNYLAIHSLMATAMTKRVIRDFDAVIVMSHRMVKEIRSVYPNAPVLKMPDPINLQNFTPLDKQVARALLGFSKNTEKWVLFTTVSNTNPIKRVPLAIEAVKRANQRMGGIQLRIATGLTSAEMPVFVGACDLALCTSLHEGWPNSLKEALACNIPFVATDVSDLADIAKQEPTCRICPPDPDILADNICDVLSTRKTIDLRSHVIEMDVPTISRRLVDLYQALLSRKQTQRTMPYKGNE